jgi:hypothetical protein
MFRAACTLLLGVLLLSGCDRTEAAPVPASAVTAAPVCGAPLLFVAMQDKTGSAEETRTPDIRLDELEPVLRRVTECGGEISLGIIDEQSNSSLARLYVPEPPERPSEPVRSGAPGAVARALKEHRAQLAAYTRTDSLRRAEAGRRAAAFRAEAERLLALPRDAQRSDIWGGISRAAYVLGEPGTWRRDPVRVAAVASDAQDNVGALSAPWPQDAELFLINGDPVLEHLQTLKPVRFESFGAAVRFILERG